MSLIDHINSFFFSLSPILPHMIRNICILSAIVLLAGCILDDGAKQGREYVPGKPLQTVHAPNRTGSMLAVNEGITAGNADDDEGALSHFEKAIELDPGYGYAHMQKARALRELGKINDSVRSFEMSVQLEPDNQDAWYEYGILVFSSGDAEGGIIAFEKVIKMNDTYPGIWTAKGSAHGKLKEYYRALEAFDKAIELNPNNAVAWSDKGRALYFLGREDEANDAIAKAVELDPYVDSKSG